MTEITTICQECQKQFEYDLKPGFPRKYCFKCSEAKKASFNSVQKPEDITTEKVPKSPQNGSNKIKEPTGEYQSLVYNKTLAANSYEVGKSGDRFKLYFETVEELQAKIKELKDAGLMVEDFVEEDLRGIATQKAFE